MKREPDPAALPALASQPISLDVLRGEVPQARRERPSTTCSRRVARALASVEAEPLRAEWEQRFARNLQAGRDRRRPHHERRGHRTRRPR